MDNKNLEKQIDAFLGDITDFNQENLKNSTNGTVIQMKDGLIERINKNVITTDGRMLLKENLY